MKKIVVFSIPVLCLIMYFSAGFYSLSKSNIEDVVICGTNNDTHYIPSGLCEYYLFNFRVTDDDVSALETGVGLAFLFGIQDETKRYTYLEHFLSKGVSINAINNVDGLSPLHSAIVLNDSKLVDFLLVKGASTSQKDDNYGLTPFNFLMYLNEKNQNIDRKPIMDILSNASL